MKHRLHVLISPELDARIKKAARLQGLTKANWVRQALVAALPNGERSGRSGEDPLLLLVRLNAPTADIDEMLSQIDGGRS